MFVKHGCPRRQQSQNMAKISKSYILTPPHPQGQVMSVKCEEPIDELTVQVWLLYDHPNFKYCTLFVSGTELRTDRRTDGQTDKRTDRRTIRLLDAPGGPFRPGALKTSKVVIFPNTLVLNDLKPAFLNPSFICLGGVVVCALDFHFWDWQIDPQSCWFFGVNFVCFLCSWIVLI